MLEDNPLWQTQLMKYMFALDFYFNKKTGKPLTMLRYASAPHGPVIDKHDDVINYLLNNNYLSTISFDDKIKLITKISLDEKLFSNEELSCMRYVKETLKGKTANELSDWSHNFDGWKNTKRGGIIDFNKYIDNFNLETLK